ncbi:MAG: VCBS repeat-containing protein [Planctomycetes bacterium]|nr:VCBS repeat-containing protein [Planctomycetota bacterium]
MADSCDIAQGAGDCNENDVPDECDIAEGTSVDCNANLIPDECEPEEPDCNDNGIADSCDIAQGTSQDCTANGIPDECEPDCNDNGMADSCDIADGSSDCNENAIPDECDIAQGTSEDCNGNELPDECEPDCNTNGVADSCDIAQGTSQDCTDNGIPDECEPDCDENGFADSCEIAHGASDCNENGVPDECDLVVSEHTIAPAIDPWQVFAADFDGDGDADALAPLEGSHEIAWYENTDGMGSFGKTHYISFDAFLVRSVFAADLDGDGDTDVLSASADGKVAWYENTDGLGSFGPEQVITANADGAQFVFAADLDGDGDTDVLSASFIDDKIAWYENTDGLGNFGPEQIVTTAADNARSVFAADLDGDGDADVLSASIDDDKIAWYENTDSLGNFGPQRVITTGANGARSVVAADLDGDGDADVLSASFDSDEIAWYENTDGLASFGPPQIITNTADGAESVFVADMDGDGHADVLSASFWDDKIAWYKNTDGLGNFGPQEVISTAADGAISVFAADLDGDGDLDVLSASFDADIAWYAIPVASDCNEDGIPDLCDIEGGTSLDCSGNGIPDDCDIAEGTSEDCNLNGFPDECDLASGTSADENGTGVPDECETVLFVYGEAAGGNDGTSWADAFTSLQDALTAAGANDAFHTEIWVAAGVHSPTDPGGDRNDTFALLNDVSIYGGFSASEMTRAQRDPAVNVTILSGDLNADDPTSDCCEANGSPGCNDGECEDSVCAVISSCCDLEWDDVCAALAASLCGDCAGGVGDNSYHVVTASATDETAILDGFTVTAGHADGVAADGEGGGVHIILGSPTISNCVVVGNFADAGGGMYTLDGSPVLFNCLFSGNSGGVGGGLRASGGFPTLVNCTFGDNHALSIGGGIYVFSGAVGVTNCILWGNTGEVDPTIEASQILLLASTAVVSYTDIEGLDTFAGNGNIGSDPLFVDPGADFHLSPGSPCIDAANNDMVPRDSSDLDGDGDTSEPASLDLDGNPRFVDDPATEDTGIPGTPGPPVVDMGVHEFQVQKKLCEGDANGDGIVDPLDSGFVLARFGCPVGTGDPLCDTADQNGDGLVDPLDVGYVLARFGECR